MNAFNEAFEIAPEVAYDPEWENGTGYLNGATTWVPDTIDGFIHAVYKATDPSGRKILLIPIRDGRYGTHVIFERFSSSNDGIVVLVHNAPPITAPITGNGALSDKALVDMIGFVMKTEDGRVRALHGLNDKINGVLEARRQIVDNIVRAEELAEEQGIKDNASPGVVSVFIKRCANFMSRFREEPAEITIHERDNQHVTFEFPIRPSEQIKDLLSRAVSITVA